jgi:serine/threonine protein kinase/tetratricopeptide (TPR) repeat protein
MLSPGDVVGPYRVIEELGTGGMGSVWLAERSDGKPRRRVALKLPRMVWASDLSERMERERDILASLEHPNIARLYDAGLDEQSRPYLAIEYVEGVRITHYCEEHRLDTRRRVELFIQVLAAVQYAHNRLVLHRDLKPGNILVNRNGGVRLLDFGIAKLIEETQPDGEADMITMTRALTPRYASPEQLRSERLTLVSDVYSLGVILHELLTGVSPYPASVKSRAEVELAVIEGVSTPPSRRVATEAGTADLQLSGVRLSRELRGDLDAVMLKSLAVDVSARYASVEALAADLTRWLDGRPVLAVPPSAFVIARKFVMRNRLAVSVATIATLGVLTTSGVEFYQAKKATAESQRAAATRDFLIDMFESANPELHGGREATVRELVSAAERVLYSSLDSQPLVQAEMLGSLVNVWLRLGDLRRANAMLGKKIQALEDAGEQSALLASLIDKVSLSLSIGDLETAEKFHRRLVENRFAVNLAKSDEATLLWQGGWISFYQGRSDLAIERFGRAARLSKDIGKNTLLISALYGLSLAHKTQRDWGSAVRSLREARKWFSLSGADIQGDLVGGIELLAAYVSLGLYQEGQLFLEKDLKGVDSFVGKSLDMASLYDLALSLRLRKFDKVFPEEMKSALTHNDALSIERQLLFSSLLIDSGSLSDAKKIISSVELVAGDAKTATRIQIMIRRLRIAIYEKNEREANTQAKLLESAIEKGIKEDEVIARSNAILGVYWFAKSSDEISAGHFMKSAKTYSEKYGDRHPKFLEAMLAYNLVVRANSLAVDPSGNDSLSSALILEGLRQAYPQDHPIIALAESLVTDDLSVGVGSSSAADRDEVLKGLLILS